VEQTREEEEQETGNLAYQKAERIRGEDAHF